MSDHLTALLIATIAASGALGGAVATVLVKRMGKGKDDADVRTTDINNLRSIIAELRASELSKSERIDGLEDRLSKLEERERHMLTRAAVHEAWDQMAFAMLIAQHPNHPPPPPLNPPNELPAP